MSSAVRLYSSHLRWIGASIGLPTRLVRPLSRYIIRIHFRSSMSSTLFLVDIIVSQGSASK